MHLREDRRKDGQRLSPARGVAVHVDDTWRARLEFLRGGAPTEMTKLVRMLQKLSSSTETTLTMTHAPVTCCALPPSDHQAT